ncbi:MAG: hypothetical protein JSW61_13115 [Candidatus Thorarchaeota archaeon]|nr:MAG: hypothetical protein JSW61_13115 [Candidatus Thorarchaeota archaeon]
MQVDATFFFVMLVVSLVCYCACYGKLGCRCAEDDFDAQGDRTYRTRVRHTRTAPWLRIPTYEPVAKSKAVSARRPISGVSEALRTVPRGAPERPQDVRALRGGEFIGNRMRFKVKVFNDSPYIITDVRVYLISYPREALSLVGEDDVYFGKIEPDGFRSPHFDFMPTQDCVKGNIVAGVAYIDHRGAAHTLQTRPFVIRSVCDLLQPEQIAPSEFELKLQNLAHGELVVKVDEWTPEEMHEKTLRILDESNFHEVTSELDASESVVMGKVSGWARGKYTGKNLGVEVWISGKSSEPGATCRIKVSGEDDAMILPAIDDLKERLSAWLCPMCGGKLSMAAVAEIQSGKSVTCPYCSVSVAR